MLRLLLAAMAAALVSLTAGCAVQIGISASAASTLGLGLAGIVFVGEELRDESAPPPTLDPDRVINEQDCTQPFDPTLGNLRCK